MIHHVTRFGAALLLAAGISGAARAQEAGTLRIAMTASDIPTTNGQPNNGYEGMRFLGYPVFESLVLWDLSRADVLAGVRPGLAESWEQDATDPKIWRFRLRAGVTFHDGTPWNADAAIWGLDRFYRNDAPNYDPQGSALTRPRTAGVAGYRKIDDMTIEMTSDRPLSYFPYIVPYILFSSPRAWESAGRDWARVGNAPAGTGPFRVTRFSPRQSVELSRNDNYWDTGRRAKLNRVILLPVPDANTRVAALRSGQVDWIEAPPPDAMGPLRSANFQVVTNSYPHVWPWTFAAGRPDSPVADVRVRQALNYCLDREGLVGMLQGIAEPSVGFYLASNPLFGNPQNRYRLDVQRGRALLAEAGYTAQRPLRLKVAISNSGSGQMQPLPMNEAIQQNLRENCGVQVNFEVVEWNVLLGTLRAEPTQPGWLGADATNVSLTSSDPFQMARWFLGANASPRGSNSGHWRDAEFDAAMTEIETARTPEAIVAATRRAHERLVDGAPWLYIVHDTNPRAMSRRVHGFVSAQSWFQDLTTVEVR
ncbi:ABC transporter substrate-binding protein [Roseococcus sp. YIM B11640]|uniref:ABC transporter substrate-binding protein n=1 Tax=Roseococcus sp. YIM B11640 TaxID=3133973 RepID=UPI003C7B6F9E